MYFIVWILIGLMFVLVITRFIIPVTGVQMITVTEVKERLKEKNTQFVDVRTPGEFKAKHSKPFINIPLQQLSSKVDQLDKNKEVVLICQSGMRSMQAAKILKKHGFKKITNVKGGMNAWY